MHSIDLYISSLIIFFTRIVSSIELSVDECLEIGFRKSELSCLRCEELIKFDLLSVKDSCLKCCQKESNDESIKKYSSARLEVCGWKVGHFPQINAFIRGDKSNKFPNLTIKYVRGADPVIKLLDTNGDVVDELNIGKWDTDTIDEFLSQHLE